MKIQSSSPKFQVMSLRGVKRRSNPLKLQEIASAPPRNDTLFITFVLLYFLLLVFYFVSPVFAIDTAEAKEPHVLKTIVIDAGHGGDDTGAIGPTGIKEKDIVLAVAKKLKDRLSKKFNAHIVLTREDDTFIPLEERTKIANENKADLFISIHTNAAFRKGANGVETYFLSFDASDEDARRVAAFENRVADLDGKSQIKDTDNLKAILMDMTQTEYLNESSQIAEIIQNNLSTELGGENRGVKQAPFFVLMGTAMPAVLVEIGFITNPQDEKRLASNEIQDMIANSLLKSIAGFEEVLKIKVGYAK
ncbi:MAG: N-acetylmuramoyl-L-alanine amidase [Deltaproteobacteria bacterium]|nr:N-acetylmuramoyl-L-alanine amidase [Deltaproteobacteria bacterium]